MIFLSPPTQSMAMSPYKSTRVVRLPLADGPILARTPNGTLWPALVPELHYSPFRTGKRSRPTAIFSF